MDAVVALNGVSELSDADRVALHALSLAVYPQEGWADWPGRELEWAAAQWCVRVWERDEKLVAYVGIVLRQAIYDGRPVWIGGVGGIKTHPAARGRGYASLGIRRAMEFLREQPNVGFALLVCEPHLIAYYSRLGWQEFAGRLLVTQHGRVVDFTFNRVMVYGVQSAGPSAGTIDLSGPPW